MSNSDTSRRVLVIGLDGFEERIANALIEHGRLPNFRRMFAEGAYVPVDHGEAKRSGLAWEHFATGLSPAGASRWSAVTFDPHTYQCAQHPTRLEPFAQRLPVTTVVFDPPYFDLHRADDVQGVVSWGAHDPGTRAHARPAGLAAEIEARFGPYPAEPYIYGYTWASADRSQAMAEDIVRATNVRADVTEWLFGERLPDWQLGVVVISEFHSAVEALWHGVDDTHPLHTLPSAAPARAGLEGVYEAADAMLGRLAQRFADCDLLLFSFHGMGANDSDVASMALLPELMYRRHFRTPRLRPNVKDPCAVPPVGEDESWSAHVRSQFLPQTPSRWQKLTKRLHGRRDAPPPLPDDTHPVPWMPASWYQPFWHAMPVFAMPSFYDGQLRLNVEGREAQGCVSAEDYDALCADLARELRALINPRTGEPAVDEVVFTHPGAPQDVHPTEADIIILWRGAPLAVQTPDGDVVGPLPYRRPGGHTGGDGCAVWLGPSFASGRKERASAFDVVPTLCDYLCGMIPDPCDGTSFLARVLANASEGLPGR